MWPWEHAAAGFLVLSVLTLVWMQRWPVRTETLVILFTTQLLDLVDKPLSWTFGVLPSGHSFAHSLLTAIVLIVLVRALAHRYSRPGITPAFGVGYVIHLITDLPLAVLYGDFPEATFILWPLLYAPTYPGEPSFIAHFAAIEFSNAFILQTPGVVIVGIVMV